MGRNWIRFLGRCIKRAASWVCRCQWPLLYWGIITILLVMAFFVIQIREEMRMQRWLITTIVAEQWLDQYEDWSRPWEAGRKCYR